MVIADAIGLTVIFTFILLLGGQFFAPVSVENLPTYIFVLLPLGFISVFLWRRDNSDTSKSLWAAVATVFLGALFFGVDVLFGLMFHPELPWFDAAKHGGGLFGILATLLICPVFTLICVGGAARAHFLKWRKSDG